MIKSGMGPQGKRKPENTVSKAKMETKEAVVILLDYSISDETATRNVLSAGLIADAESIGLCEKWIGRAINNLMPHSEVQQWKDWGEKWVSGKDRLYSSAKRVERECSKYIGLGGEEGVAAAAATYADNEIFIQLIRINTDMAAGYAGARGGVSFSEGLNKERRVKRNELLAIITTINQN